MKNLKQCDERKRWFTPSFSLKTMGGMTVCMGCSEANTGRIPRLRKVVLVGRMPVDVTKVDKLRYSDALTKGERKLRKEMGGSV